eukprot:s63_g22.t1
MPKSSAQPKKVALKKQAKLEQKQQKQQKKNEDLFAKALNKFGSSALEADKLYIDQSLEQTPGWIQPLAAMIRAGALNALLKSHTDQDAGCPGRRWKGKASKLVHIPSEVKIAMLQACLSEKQTIPDPLLVRPEWVDFAFEVQFWCTGDTPLPSHPTLRTFETMVQLGVDRVAELKFNFLSENLEEQEDEKVLWSLQDADEGAELVCHLWKDPVEVRLPKFARWCQLVFVVNYFSRWFGSSRWPGR